MSPAQRFLVVFFLIVIPSLIGLTITAIWIEPLDGPLTRMGGYAERDYGWMGKQQTLGIEDVSMRNYQTPADVLVIGDSFSKPGLWQAYLKQNTGLNIVTLDLGKTSFDDLLQEPMFLKHPPRLVIVESVEVFFLSKFRQANPSCESSATMPKFQPLEIRPKSLLFRNHERVTRITPGNLNLKYALVYLQRGLQRSLTAKDNSPVSEFQLARPDLFSNRLSNRLLVFRQDLDKSSWQNKDINAAICEIRRLQQRFQNNGITVFVFLLIPDKLTAYTPFIIDNGSLPAINLNKRLANQGIQTPNLDTVIQGAISKGERDIYLPNETHFGWRGHEITAQTVSKYLQKIGVLTIKTKPLNAGEQ